MQVLLYPTAIGSEPPNPSYNSYPHWTRVMQGHAGANMVRVGGGWVGGRAGWVGGWAGGSVGVLMWPPSLLT